MKKAIPIDKDGCAIGGAKNFSDEQWDTMIYNYGKKLRWRLVEEKEEKPEIERIWDDPEEEIKPEFTETKHELIDKYGLPEELMKSKRDEIIKIINEGELYK